MSKGAGLKLAKTRNIRHPSIYVQKIYNEYSKWVFDENDAIQFKNQWKNQIFKIPSTSPLHVEIGTGTGFHLAEKAKTNPQDSFIGIELKYKPLIQSIRRCTNNNSSNVRMIRYNATLITHLFGLNEINNIYIHFPDPWLKRRQSKHRLFSYSFIQKIYSIQKSNSIVEIKTDCQTYFENIYSLLEKNNLYKPIEYTSDLYSIQKLHNHGITTSFEQLFINKGIPICYAQFRKI